MANEIGIGVIGMGWMGQVHARSYRQLSWRFPGLAVKPKLIICSDNVRSRAESARETSGFEVRTANWHDGFMRLIAGEQYPYHGRFNPGEGSGISYEDLKIIEVYEGRQPQPGFKEDLEVGNVHTAMVLSWSSESSEALRPISAHADIKN